MYAYTVTCEFPDPAVAEQWVRWLRDEHLRKVCEAGALSAEVIHLDGMPEGSVRCEARYRFASRADFDRYEREHAPRLRQEGLERFPLSHGISYTRTTGEVVAHMD